MPSPIGRALLCYSLKLHAKESMLLLDYFNAYGAVAIENNAMPNLTSVKGLGRDWSWQEFVEADKNQIALCGLFAETDMPCGCFDG